MNKVKVLFEILGEALKDFHKFLIKKNDITGIIIMIISSFIFFYFAWVGFFFTILSSFYCFKWDFKEMKEEFGVFAGVNFLISFGVIAVLTIFIVFKFDANNKFYDENITYKNPSLEIGSNSLFIVTDDKTLEISEEQYVRFKTWGCKDIILNIKKYNNKEHEAVKTVQEKHFICVQDKNGTKILN